MKKVAIIIEEDDKNINQNINQNYKDYEQNNDDPCVHCNNNPRNGGSGICHCILGQKNIITC